MAFNFRGMFNRGGVLDAASGGTPMDASQPYQQQQPNQGNMQNPFKKFGIFDDQSGGQQGNGAGSFYGGTQGALMGIPGMSGMAGRYGRGQQSGPWGSAMQGGMNPGQGYFSQNNMGMYQGTPQRPFGMGNNPMMNMMNPYQGNMYGNYGNPNQRQPFMGGGQSPWGQQQNYMQQMYGQGQNMYGGGGNQRPGFGTWEGIGPNDPAPPELRVFAQ